MGAKIESQVSYDIVMRQIEKYIQKGFENLNELETKHLKELSEQAEEYEMQDERKYFETHTDNKYEEIRKDMEGLNGR